MIRTAYLVCLFCTSFGVACCGDDSSPSTSTAAPLKTVYVDAAASPDGDGSSTAPLRSLQEAIDVVSAERIVLVSGTYEVPSLWTVDRPLSIEGASTDTVFLTAGEVSPVWTLQEPLVVRNATLFAPLTATRGSLTLESLSVAGDKASVILDHVDSAHLSETTFQNNVGLVVRGSKDVSVRSCVFEGARIAAENTQGFVVESTAIRNVAGPGLFAQGSDVVLKDLEVEDISEAEGEGGDGVSIRGGSVSMTGGRVERAKDRAVALGATQATLTSVTLRGGGRAVLSVQGRTEATLSDATLEGGTNGIFLADSSLTAERIRVPSVRGIGVLTSDNATLTLRNSEFGTCPQGHVSLLYEGTGGTIEGNTFDGASAACVSAFQTRAGLRVLGNTVRNCVGSGLSVGNSTGVVLRDNVVEAIEADPVFTEVADAISLVDATCEVRGNTLRNTRNAGVGMIRSVVVMEDNRIESTDSVGVSVLDPGDGDVRIVNNVIDGVGGAGVFVSSSSLELITRVFVERNVVRGVVFDAGTGLGDGVAFGLGAHVDVVGNEIDGCGTNGVAYFGGARGRVAQNTLRSNRGYGVRGYCDGETSVEVEGNNVFENNTRGDVQVCP